MACIGAEFRVGLSLVWPLSMSCIIRAAEDSTDRASSLALAFLIVRVLLSMTFVLVVVRPGPEDPH